MHPPAGRAYRAITAEAVATGGAEVTDERDKKKGAAAAAAAAAVVGAAGVAAAVGGGAEPDASKGATDPFDELVASTAPPSAGPSGAEIHAPVAPPAAAADEEPPAATDPVDAPAPAPARPSTMPTAAAPSSSTEPSESTAPVGVDTAAATPGAGEAVPDTAVVLEADQPEPVAEAIEPQPLEIDSVVPLDGATPTPIDSMPEPVLEVAKSEPATAVAGDPVTTASTVEDPIASLPVEVPIATGGPLAAAGGSGGYSGGSGGRGGAGIQLPDAVSGEVGAAGAAGEVAAPAPPPPPPPPPPIDDPVVPTPVAQAAASVVSPRVHAPEAPAAPPAPAPPPVQQVIGSVVIPPQQELAVHVIEVTILKDGEMPPDAPPLAPGHGPVTPPPNPYAGVKLNQLDAEDLAEVRAALGLSGPRALSEFMKSGATIEQVADHYGVDVETLLAKVDLDSVDLAAPPPVPTNTGPGGTGPGGAPSTVQVVTLDPKAIIDVPRELAGPAPDEIQGTWSTIEIQEVGGDTVYHSEVVMNPDGTTTVHHYTTQADD